MSPQRRPPPPRILWAGDDQSAGLGVMGGVSITPGPQRDPPTPRSSFISWDNGNPNPPRVLLMCSGGAGILHQPHCALPGGTASPLSPQHPLSPLLHHSGTPKSPLSPPSLALRPQYPFSTPLVPSLVALGPQCPPLSGPGTSMSPPRWPWDPNVPSVLSLLALGPPNCFNAPLVPPWRFWYPNVPSTSPWSPPQRPHIPSGPSPHKCRAWWAGKCHHCR